MNIHKPVNPVPKGQMPPNTEAYAVKAGESLDSIAKDNSITWRALARLNWKTDLPSEINWYLQHNHGYGPADETADHQNYKLRAGDIIYIPQQSQAPDFPVCQLDVDFPEDICVAPMTPDKPVDNILVLQARLSGDWVIEQEIPDALSSFDGFFASPEYLAWTKHRYCFVDDCVEIRLKIENRLLTDQDQVTLRIEDDDPWFTGGNAHVLTITTRSDLKGSDVEQRQLEVRTDDLGRQSLADTANKILYHPDPATKQTTLVTSVKLPLHKDYGDISELVFKASIRTPAGVTEFTSEEINVLPWWAESKVNAGYDRTVASAAIPLVDGELFFAAVLAAVTGASSYIYISSWSFCPETPLNAARKTLKEALADAATRGVKIYLLLDYFHTSWTRFARSIHPDVKVATCIHPTKLFGNQFGTYHDKFTIVDGTKAFCGGIDFMPDRYNSNKHSAKLNYYDYPDFYGRPFWLWHDIGVEVEGRIVKDLVADFTVRWNRSAPATDAISTVPSTAVGDLAVQYVKTDGSNGVHGTLRAYELAIKSARHYIYIENQYFFYPRLGEYLEQALLRNEKLQVIVILPFVTEEGGGVNLDWIAEQPHYVFQDGAMGVDLLQKRMYMHGYYLQHKIVAALRAVPNSADRVGVFALGGCLNGVQEQIYPHSKIMIVDDTWAIIGSANANGRGFMTDSESNIVIHDRKVVTAYRRSLWREHINLDIETRQLHDCLPKWQSRALPKRARVRDFTCADLSSKRVCNIDPPRGREYDGPLDWVPSFAMNVDEFI